MRIKPPLKYEDKFIVCNCLEEGVRITFWSDGDVFISIWKNRGVPKIKWSLRLKHIWNILRKGDPWAEDIMLNRDTTKELATFLSTKLKEYSNEEIVRS